jgi:hypothetical protein
MIILSPESSALLRRMTPEERKAQAEQAIAEYNATYEQGGEIEYPMWADQVLKACAEAEQLTLKVLELGANNNG